MFKGFSYTQIYNSIEKVEAYWNAFKPTNKPTASYIHKWTTQANFFKQLSFHSCAAIVVWDVISHRFVYVADERGVFGHDISLFTKEDGIDFSLSNVHPDFLNAFLTLQKHGIEYCMKNPEYADEIILSCDCLYKKNSGIYFKLMQQAVIVETNNEGQPLVFLSYIHDISHLKKDFTLNLIIKAPHEVQIWNYDFEIKELEKPYVLTSQENKILSLLSEGKQTKEIAEILCCSPHTVDTHRRNLIKKTNCLDTTAVVTYAHMTGLI